MLKDDGVRGGDVVVPERVKHTGDSGYRPGPPTRRAQDRLPCRSLLHHQPIPHARLRDQQFRLGWARLELLSQVGHVNPQLPHPPHVIRTPDLSRNPPVREHPARVLHEEAQQRVLGRRQLDPLAFGSDRPGCHIHT